MSKEAVEASKIYYTGTKPNQRFDYESTGFLHLLNSEEWKSFQDKEKQCRAEIVPKSINYGDFVYKGNINLWNQLFRKLYRIFYKSDCFYYKQPSGVQWSVNFQIFVVFVLKKFPRDAYYCYHDEYSLLEHIRKQLDCIHTPIIQLFDTKSHDNTNNVTKDKLM